MTPNKDPPPLWPHAYLTSTTPTLPLTSDWPGPLFPTFLFPYKYGQFPACPHSHFIACWRWNRYSVTKRRLLILRRRGNTQKTICHYNNTAKAWKLELWILLVTFCIVIIRCTETFWSPCISRSNSGAEINRRARKNKTATDCICAISVSLKQLYYGKSYLKTPFRSLKHKRLSVL
jgi:hypothetical protein